MVRLFFTLLLSLSFLIPYSQCAGDITYTLSTPPNPDNTYPPGANVQLCVTMTGWNGNSQGSNWFEGVGLDLGVGWDLVNPVSPPADAESDASGTWIWVESVTSDATGLTVGPGYFFEGPTGPTDGNPGNDWGDFCSMGDCVWEFCVDLTVANVAVPLDLTIGVTPYSDGTMGSWGTESCFDPEIPVFDGTIGCLITGCTNPLACNFNPNAGCDDGGCILPGCTDPSACNYDVNAPCDDGSCVYGGCTDPGACNFNPLAGCDDGSCDYFSMGNVTSGFGSDTVCVGLEIIYSVTGNENSSYTWSVTGGEIGLSDQPRDCKIIWGTVPGTYTITAQETTPSGCIGPIETHDVVVVSPDITFDSSYRICYNQSVELSANPPGGSWSGQHVNGDVFIGYVPGVSWPTYTVQIHGCEIQESIDVTVYPVYQGPSIIYSDLFVDLCLSDGQQVYYAADDRSETYNWSLDGITISSDMESLSINWPDTSGTYLLSVYGMDHEGCLSGITSINVEVQMCHRIYIPNSFTPNGDGVNDVFGFSGVGIYDPRLIVYNRWGNPVFETSDMIEVWTGDDGAGYYSESGAYNWKVYYKDNEGFKREKSGVVLLIR